MSALSGRMFPKAVKFAVMINQKKTASSPTIKIQIPNLYSGLRLLSITTLACHKQITLKIIYDTGTRSVYPAKPRY
jgi:hypothetical protein